MGIVAVATAVVVHAVQKVQRTGRTVTCQSNLRQIGEALFAYLVDNNGSYPYGYYYHPRDPVTWQPGNSEARTIAWPDVINAYLVEPGHGELSERFRCPDAQAQTFPHRLSYVMNIIVGVAPDLEFAFAAQAPPAQLKPSRIERMRREGTSLVWDTAIRADLGSESLGYIISADLDDTQRFWAGAGTPQWRYYDASDVYGRIPPGIYGNNKPVRFNGQFRNIDPTTSPGYPYQGNLRFRHVDNKCNALFSDGSVRQFTGVLGTSGIVSTPDAIRRLFMTEWPPNTPRNFSVP